MAPIFKVVVFETAAKYTRATASARTAKMDEAIRAPDFILFDRSPITQSKIGTIKKIKVKAPYPPEIPEIDPKNGNENQGKNADITPSEAKIKTANFCLFIIIILVCLKV